MPSSIASNIVRNSARNWKKTEPTRSQLQTLQPLQNIQRNEEGNARKFQTEVNDRDGQEHQIQGRYQNARIGQGIKQLAWSGAHFRIEKQQTHKQGNRPPAGASDIASCILHQF